MGLNLIDKTLLQSFKDKMDVVLEDKVNTSDKATSDSFGIAKVDGETITSNDGVLTAIGSGTTLTQAEYDALPEEQKNTGLYYISDGGGGGGGGGSYTLPKASTTVLGGIKVGTNLSIDNDGVLSATDTTYSVASGSADGLLSSEDFTKLSGIAEGAEVNVQSDWNASSGDAFIKNKPTSLPASDVYTWAKAENKPEYTASDVGADAAGSATTALNSAKDYTDTVASNKVDKVTGKGLSENDFTDALKTKLDSIASGAEVNVQSDWNATSGDAFIKNKPTSLPASDVYSWAKEETKPTYTSSEVGAVSLTPDGTNDLISNNKVNEVYLPDYLLGQLLYGGNVASNVATLTLNAKTKLGTTQDTITLTNDSTAITGYVANSGLYYIATTDSTFAGLSILTGDWLLSTGTAWTKIDNTDAVTGVKGSSESVYRTGNINITKANIGLGNVTNTSDANKPVSTAQQTALDAKVDKVTGKGLSENDFTTTLKDKLDGIASGAEVNVQSDWNATSGDAFIKNKPSSMPASDVSAWAKEATKPTYTATEVGLGNVPNVSTNNQTPTYSTASTLTTLTSGEKISVAFGKIKKAITDLISHIADTVSHTTSTEKATWDAKQNAITGAATTIDTENLTASRALVSNSSGKVAVSAVTSTELGYIDGVTSNVQTQLNNRAVNMQLTNEDLNDITTPGFYYASNNTCANTPNGYQYAFGLEVIRQAGGNYRTQVCYMSSGAIPYRRYCANGTWSDWVQDKYTDHTYDLTTMINELSPGASTPSDDDYYVAQYANGGTDNTTFVRRKTSAIWNYIKSKADSVYSIKNHASTATTYGNGTDTNYGHLKLSNATNSSYSTDGGTAATPAAVKAAYDHASEMLPKAGGSMTGNIKYKSAFRDESAIRFLPNESNANGDGISIGDGGVVIIGAGESATAMQSVVTNPATENLYLTADGVVCFYTACNSIANRKGVILDTTRCLHPDVTNQGGLGSSSYHWNAAYINTVYGALSGNASTATKLETARTINLGGNCNSNATFDGSGDITLNDYGYNCMYEKGNTNLYPYGRIAHVEATANYTDNNIILCIDEPMRGGNFGIVKITLRGVNQSTDTPCAAANVEWLVRKGFSLNSVQVGVDATPSNYSADVFFKCRGAYCDVAVTQIASNDTRTRFGRSWTLISCKEPSNCTTQSQCVECYANISDYKTYSTIVESIDSGVVSNSSSADKLTTARTINGTSFNGTANVTVPLHGKVQSMTLTIGVGVTTYEFNGAEIVGCTSTEDKYAFIPLTLGVPRSTEIVTHPTLPKYYPRFTMYFNSTTSYTATFTYLEVKLED